MIGGLFAFCLILAAKICKLDDEIIELKMEKYELQADIASAGGRSEACFEIIKILDEQIAKIKHKIYLMENGKKKKGAKEKPGD